MWVPWSNALPRTRAARLARALASHPGWDAAATAAAAATPAGLRPTHVVLAAANVYWVAQGLEAFVAAQPGTGSLLEKLQRELDFNYQSLKEKQSYHEEDTAGLNC